MKIFAMIIGVVAVTVFLLSFQQKTRGRIIALNATSRVLYILQYLLLGAISGAVLDVIGIAASLLAGVKRHPKFKRYMKLLVPAVFLVYLVTGALTYKSYVDLFSLAGVIIHSWALFLDDEKKIRVISLVGSPFWLAYNISNLAIGSALGDTLSICSIIIAMFRYDIPRKGRNAEDGKGIEDIPTEDTYEEDETRA